MAPLNAYCGQPLDNISLDSNSVMTENSTGNPIRELANDTLKVRLLAAPYQRRILSDKPNARIEIGIYQGNVSG